jgi:cobalamin biosynthesis protein CobT
LNEIQAAYANERLNIVLIDVGAISNKSEKNKSETDKKNETDKNGGKEDSTNRKNDTDKNDNNDYDNNGSYNDNKYNKNSDDSNNNDIDFMKYNDIDFIKYCNTSYENIVFWGIGNRIGLFILIDKINLELKDKCKNKKNYTGKYSHGLKLRKSNLNKKIISIEKNVLRDQDLVNVESELERYI